MPQMIFGDTSRDATLYGSMADADDALMTQIQLGVYPPTGTPGLNNTDTALYAARTLQVDGYYRTVNGLVRWNTSALPSAAVITSASLRLVGWGFTSNVDSLAGTGEWYNGWTGASGDYTATPSSTAFGGWDPTGLTAGVTYNIALSNPNTNVNRSGNTGIRLHVTQRASDAAPTGYNEWYFASRNHATYNEPQLVVNYTLNPVPPDSLISSSGFTGSYTDAVTDDANWLIGV